MRLLSLAVGADATRESTRLARAAESALGHALTAGFDLDDPRGAGLAFELIADAAAELPLPGSGRTAARLSGLAGVGEADLALGRLVEAHADAVAILAELGGPVPQPGQRWGVWAAEGPQATVQAHPRDGGWVLNGIKPWCSGSGLCTHALVTAAGPEGHALYAVALEPDTCRPMPGSWRSVGLTGTMTEPVEFVSATASRVGDPGSYLTRAGFWHGAIGVAAVWWGGAAGVAAALYQAVAAGRADAHALAHLGAIEVGLESSAAMLRQAAVAMDEEPTGTGERCALTVRAGVEQTATDIIERVGRALGPGPLCHDRAHARRVADLAVYIRQTHAERDLERLGALAAGRP